MHGALRKLKHLPRRLIPDPRRFLPEPDRLRGVEAGMGITIGVVLTSLGAGLLLRWIPLPISPLALVCLLAGATAFGLAYGTWRSKHYHECWGPGAGPQAEGHTSGNLYGELKREENLWLWGWAVPAQFLAGTALVATAVLVL